MPASTTARPRPDFRKINREAPERPCSSSGASCSICGKGRSAKGNYQPSLGDIITGETHKGGITAYRREVPDTPVKITVAELTETTVMHKKMSAPEVGRHNLQTVKVENPSIRPRGGQKHICKCS